MPTTSLYMTIVSYIRTTAALLLSLGLVYFALGSDPSGGHEVFSDLDFEVVHGQLGKVRAQTLKRDKFPSASAGTTTATWLPGGAQTRNDVAGVIISLLSKPVEASVLLQRKLQESACADGTTSISVSSTAFPLMEGCLSPSVVDGAVWYTAGVATIVPFSATTTDPPLWFAVYEDSSGESTVACFSGESADDVDPSEATWFCDIDGDGSTFTMADEELSVSCGCSVTSPSPLVTLAPVSSTTEPVCVEGDSFSVVSDTFLDAEGCFVNTAVLTNDQTIYTPTGTTAAGQAWMAAVEAISDDNTSLIVWALLNMISTTSSDLIEVYCVSGAEAALYHPSEVPAWLCDIDGEGFRETIGDVLSVFCGCSIAPPPSPTITSAPIPSTTIPTCGEGESFSIASETLPDAEGCYIDTSANLNDKTIYSTSGTSDSGQIWMVAVDLTEDDPSTAAVLVWALVNVASTDGSEETIFYCFSVDDAALYHPSEVQEWICDEGISIALVCGCSSSLSSGEPSPTPLPTTQPVVSPTSPRTLAPVALPMAQIPAKPATTPAPSQATDTEAQSIAATCPGDKSFTITANAAPELDGCFIGSTTNNGLFVYTLSGTTTQSEVVVFDFKTDDGNFNWYIGYVSLADSGDSRAYCVSAEQANDVHPGEASWLCDFTGNGANYVTVTNEDISIVCGACTTVVPEDSSPRDTRDASAASKLGVGVAAGGGASMVALACAYGGWY